MARILLASPHMSEQGYEKEYVKLAFDTNWIAPLGENVNEFEKALKAFLHTDYVTALSAGTAALHLAAILSGIQSGDMVFCQDLTFSASVNPICYLGAHPIFIDSERESWNMDPVALKAAFEKYGRPKAVVVVHLYGTPAKMDEITALCAQYDVPLIEDAAEGLGSTYDGKYCGTMGSFGALSFNGNKIITTSGGGALISHKEEDAAHALKLATQAREPFPWYQHEEIGYNYRLSNICAGIGRGQMKVLKDRIQKKQEMFAYYSEALRDLPLQMMPHLSGTVPNRWLSVLLLDDNAGITSAQVIEKLAEHEIESRRVWKPMHMQPVFAKEKYVQTADENVAEDLFERGVCLPSDTKNTEEDMAHICSVIRALF